MTSKLILAVILVCVVAFIGISVYFRSGQSISSHEDLSEILFKVYHDLPEGKVHADVRFKGNRRLPADYTITLNSYSLTPQFFSSGESMGHKYGGDLIPSNIRLLSINQDKLKFVEPFAR